MKVLLNLKQSKCPVADCSTQPNLRMRMSQDVVWYKQTSMHGLQSVDWHLGHSNDSICRRYAAGPKPVARSKCRVCRVHFRIYIHVDTSCRVYRPPSHCRSLPVFFTWPSCIARSRRSSIFRVSTALVTRDIDCPSVCMSHSGIVSKGLNVSSQFFQYVVAVAQSFQFFRY